MSEAALTDSTTPAVSPAFELRADLEVADEYQVAEHVLRGVGDADPQQTVVALLHPLVRLGVLQVRGMFMASPF